MGGMGKRLHRGIGQDPKFRARILHVWLDNPDISFIDMERRFNYGMEQIRIILKEEGVIVKNEETGRWVRTQGEYGINSKMDGIKTAP